MSRPGGRALLVNPAARGGRVGRLYQRHEAALTTSLRLDEARLTAGPGDAIAQVAGLVGHGVRTIFSFGGDGTHSEVLQGIVAGGAAPGDVALGLLPGGTGGDLRRLIRGPRDLLGAAAYLADAPAPVIDAGEVLYTGDDGAARRQPFINVTSFGLGGLVDRYVNESGKRLGGRVSFALGTVRALARYRPAHVRLTLDGADLGTTPVNNVFVCNGRFCGGGMHIAPHAFVDDGLFDVMILRPGGPLASLRAGVSVYSGRHLESPLFTAHRGAVLRAEPVGGGEALLDIDGEAPGAIPAEIRVLPGALRLIGVTPTALASR